MGRAGRLGFSDRGTSYLLALDPREVHQHWNRYVLGEPEDLQSRFIAADTDPRTLILRVLAGARNASIGGIPAADVIDFLEGSFGAFQRRQASDQWSWDRQGFATAMAQLEQHRLIEAGVQVESIIRLVAAFSGLNAAEITDPTLIAATQLTTEVDDVFFPMNRKSKHKEPQTWFGTLTSQGISGLLMRTLQRFVNDAHTATLRAKKAAASLFWISPTPMAQIEAALTQHGGGFDGAAGAVRSVAARTCDLLPAVAELIHPDLELSERVSRLLVRLELGVPAGIVDLARQAGTALTRSDYHDLLQAGLNTAEAIEAAEDADIGAIWRSCKPFAPLPNRFAACRKRTHPRPCLRMNRNVGVPGTRQGEE